MSFCKEDLCGATHRVDLERQHKEKQMGRPLNDRFFGNTQAAGGADLSNESRLTAVVKVTGESVSNTGIILSQRSETKFKVNDTANGTAVNTDGTTRDGSNGTGNVGFCTLVNKDVPGDGEMVIRGFVSDGSQSNPVNIRKVQNRTMIDFDNNRYTWEIQDDSTANLLILTAI